MSYIFSHLRFPLRHHPYLSNVCTNHSPNSVALYDLTLKNHIFIRDVPFLATLIYTAGSFVFRSKVCVTSIFDTTYFSKQVTFSRSESAAYLKSPGKYRAITVKSSISIDSAWRSPKLKARERQRIRQMSVPMFVNNFLYGRIRLAQLMPVATV